MPTESTFLLAGLFIIAAATGWAYARFNARGDSESPSEQLSADYLRGLNFLLNEQTDEALEVFVRMVEVDDETLETHFALGSLFRRRGEVDRAIRVHQNIIARPDLGTHHREQALHALGEDYLRAGLLDRAERLFRQLSGSPEHRQTALGNLIRIYEQEHDWDKAIDAHRELQAASGASPSDMIGHYYCELAAEALAKDDLASARKHVRRAYKGRHRTIRGTLMRADIAARGEDFKLASRLYSEVLKEDGRLVSEVLPRLAESNIALNRSDDTSKVLRKLIKQDPAFETDIARAAIVGRISQDATAADCIERFVLNNKTLASFIDVEGLQALGEEQKASRIRQLSEGLRQLAANTARYRCTACGYSSMALLWHCPGCKSWDSIRPVNNFAFDTLLTD